MLSDPDRRRLLQLLGSAAWPLIASSTATAADGAASSGVALLVGNTTYRPSSQDILTAGKNVRDLAAVLDTLGYRSQTLLDADRDSVVAALDRLIDAASGAARRPVVFYFCGHGVNSLARGQYRNFLVSSGVQLVPAPAVMANPEGRRRHYESVASQSTSLEDDVFPRFARRPAGSLGLIVVDACRDASDEVTDADNRIVQSRPPDGCVTAFATRPGRYAYTPRDRERNSYFTEALLDQLRQVQDEGDIVQLLQRVRLQVRERVNKIARDEGLLERLLARLGLKEGFLQEPEAAANLASAAFLRPERHTAQASAPAAASSGAASQAQAAQRWTEIEALDEPEAIEAALDDFLRRFPDSPQRANAALRKEDMARVRDAQRRARLTRARLNLPASGRLLQDYRAARQGDKFAAQRVAEAVERDVTLGDSAAALRWLQYAAELGNGIAAYEAYQRFNNRNLIAEASYYLNLAESSGFRVPRDFDSRK